MGVACARPRAVDDTTVKPASHVFDVFHVNSIQKLHKGKILVSLRDTSAIYKIGRARGNVNWTLGGSARATSRWDSGAEFHFQHDARC